MAPLKLVFDLPKFFNNCVEAICLSRRSWAQICFVKLLSVSVSKSFLRSFPRSFSFGAKFEVRSRQTVQAIWVLGKRNFGNCFWFKKFVLKKVKVLAIWRLTF